MLAFELPYYLRPAYRNLFCLSTPWPFHQKLLPFSCCCSVPPSSCSSMCQFMQGGYKCMCQSSVCILHALEGALWRRLLSNSIQPLQVIALALAITVLRTETT